VFSHENVGGPRGQNDAKSLNIACRLPLLSSPRTSIGGAAWWPLRTFVISPLPARSQACHHRALLCTPTQCDPALRIDAPAHPMLPIRPVPLRRLPTAFSFLATPPPPPPQMTSKLPRGFSPPPPFAHSTRCIKFSFPAAAPAADAAAGGAQAPAGGAGQIADEDDDDGLYT
jgi:hypothetical protein